jgi:hypothetical protein
MTEGPEDYPTPEAIYIHIMDRLRECQRRGEKMPSAEASQSFQQLLQSCQQLIADKERLTRAVAISDGIVEELEIEIFTKDLEIFNFTSQIEQKD